MAEKLSCPSCNAPMEIEYLKQTDKIARCAYCGSVVDLPDELPVEKVTEIEVHEQSDGWTKRRNVRVSERTGASANVAVDPQAADKLIQQVEQMLKAAGASATTDASGLNIDNNPTAKVTSSTINVTRTFSAQSVKLPQGQLPAEVRDLLSQFGLDKQPQSGAVKTVQISHSSTPAKRSFWKKLFGKS